MMMMIHYTKIIQFTFFQSESAHAPIDPRPMVCVQRFPRGRGTEFLSVSTTGLRIWKEYISAGAGTNYYPREYKGLSNR